VANKEHLKILREGVKAWNVWRRNQNPELRPGLHGTDLRTAELSGAELSHADLSGANLYGANLRLAVLHEADLTGAILNSADLSGADVTNADLTGATFAGAKLSSSSFAQTLVTSVDLSGTKGLGSASHFAPSVVSTDTLTKSKGKIPDVFLRGCGLNDWQIAAAKLENPDLNSQQVTDISYEIDRLRGESPIQISPIFISYSRTDSDFADALEPRLNDKRIRFWRDIHDMVAGPIEEQLERAIEVNRIMLLVLSRDSIESDWVESEVIRAREIAKERKEHVLCPIAIDDSWKTCPWERKLRVQVEKYNILDFSKWQDAGELDKAFQKLIEGLGIFYPKSAAATAGS